jgi:hypothetical protein
MNKENNIFELIKELENNTNKLKAELEMLEKSYSKMIIIYDDKISTKKKQLENMMDENRNYHHLLDYYSAFNVYFIGDIIAKLVTLIEGEEYFFNQGILHMNCFDGKKMQKRDYDLQMIVKKRNCKSDYTKPEFDDLFQKEYALLLYKNESCSMPKNINFTSCNIDYGRFSYIKEFIMEIINYRFVKNLKNISLEEMLAFVRDFVNRNKDLQNKNLQRILAKKNVLKKTEEQLLAKQEKEFLKLLSKTIRSSYKVTLDRQLAEKTLNKKFEEKLKNVPINFDGIKENIVLNYGMREPFVASGNLYITHATLNADFTYQKWSDDDDIRGYYHITFNDDCLLCLINMAETNKFYMTNESLENLGINTPFSYKNFRMDRLDENYLRLIYLPSEGNYTFDEWNYMQDKSFVKEWDIVKIADKMFNYANAILAVNKLDDDNLEIYKEKVLKIK